MAYMHGQAFGVMYVLTFLSSFRFMAFLDLLGSSNFSTDFSSVSGNILP